MAYDVIIIGAGHNGLTAAAYLARAGKKVLVLERRGIVGGCAVTEEVDPELAPGCRVSTASYIASMLRPSIIKDLKLAAYGLRMVACEPGVQAAFDDGDVVAWWSDEGRMRAELERIAPSDVDRFFETEDELKRLAAYLQPFFLESPPDIHATGLSKLAELWRNYRRFRGVTGDAFLEGRRHFELPAILVLLRHAGGMHERVVPVAAIGAVAKRYSGGVQGAGPPAGFPVEPLDDREQLIKLARFGLTIYRRPQIVVPGA